VRFCKKKFTFAISSPDEFLFALDMLNVRHISTSGLVAILAIVSILAADTLSDVVTLILDLLTF